MRKYKPRWGKEVNLDSPKTYKHLPQTIRECDSKMLERIGYALLYMDYFPNRIGLFPKDKVEITEKKIKARKFSGKREANSFYNCGYYQRVRVIKLIKNFANNRHKNWKNLRWFQEQLFLFDDEIENMC